MLQAGPADEPPSFTPSDRLPALISIVPALHVSEAENLKNPEH